jgi:hypothetical protein
MNKQETLKSPSTTNCWIIGVDAETGKYTPGYINIKKYKRETGYKTVVGFQTYDMCLKVCELRNKEEGRK